MTQMERIAISRYAEGIYDGPHATPKEVDEGPVFLGVTNVTEDGRLDLSDVKHISEEDFPRWTKRVLPQKDDIVFSYEATLHRYVLIPEGFRGCLGRRMGLVRPDKSKVNPKYLHYYLLSKEWRAVIESNIISGATVDRIPLKKFPEFPVRLPDLATQRRIASILSSYDELIENNRKRIKLLERAARLLYTEWFVRLRFPGHEGGKRLRPDGSGVKDGVPEGWEKGTIEDFYHTSSGGTPSRSKPEYYEGDINWVKTQELNEDFIFDTEEKITEMAISNSSAKVYPPNTLLVSMYGGTNIGRVAILANPAACNQACCALSPKVEHASIHFAFLFFGTIREQLIGISQGAAQTNISQQIVKGLKVVLPCKDVIKDFTGRIIPLFDQMRTLQAMNQQLTRARDLLLPRLMSGKVRV